MRRIERSERNPCSVLALAVSVLFFLSLFLIPASAVKAEPSRQGWYFDRVGVMGPEIVYACPAGVKISYPGHCFKLISVPPTWNAIWYVPLTHCKFEETLQAFQSPRVLPDFPFLLALPRKKVSHVGIKAIKIATRPRSTEEAPFGLPDLHAEKHRTFVRENDRYVSESLGLPKGAIALLSAYWYSPDFGGVPLAYIDQLTDGQTQKMWFTRSVKPVVVPQAELEYPKGFRQMKNWHDLAATVKGSDIDDFIRDMKLGVDFGN